MEMDEAGAFFSKSDLQSIEMLFFYGATLSVSISAARKHDHHSHLKLLSVSIAGYMFRLLDTPSSGS
jgi:hypothetical protein